MVNLYVVTGVMDEIRVKTLLIEKELAVSKEENINWGEIRDLAEDVAENAEILRDEIWEGM